MQLSLQILKWAGAGKSFLGLKCWAVVLEINSLVNLGVEAGRVTKREIAA